MSAHTTRPDGTVERPAPDHDLPIMTAHAPFRRLLRQRFAFVGVSACLLLAFNLLQPVLSVFTQALDGQALGLLTWGWIYAFAQFVVPLALLHVYVARARRFDAASAALLAGHGTEGQAL